MAVCHRNIIREEQIMSEPEIVKELDEIEALFVQTSLAAEHVDGRIILRSVTPSTLYFSDRPGRVVGHIGTSQFVDIWGVGENNFAEDPPNAVLAFLPQGMETPRDVVLEITDPVLTGADLSYSAKVLEGTMPARSVGCTLFIDPI